jgi:hypothetical protein
MAEKEVTVLYGINSPSVITSEEVRVESWKSAVAGLTLDAILFYRC